MRFLDRLRTHRVTSFGETSTSAVALFGFVLWFVPGSLYVAAAVIDEEARTRAMWIIDLALHVVVAVLVALEATLTAGLLWPLQTLIIGTATFVTFTFPAFVGVYVVRGEDVLALLALGALLCACLSNAVMVSILFELFHRGLVAPPPPPPPRRLRV